MKKLKLRVILFLTVVILLVQGGFIVSSARAQDSNPPRQKYYTSICIQDGDSLWSIAESYMSYEYESIYEYMDELCEINKLKSSTIHKDNYLIVSYYAE